MTEDEIAALPYRPNVGLMVLNSAGHVFTGQRLDYPGSAWQMPQGGIDEGEDAEIAAFRELQEETGIAPDTVSVLAQSSGWISYDFPDYSFATRWGFRGQKQRWFLMRFSGADSQINIETEEPEFAAWRWMPPEELLENIVPFKRSVYEQVLQEFHQHLFS